MNIQECTILFPKLASKNAKKKAKLTAKRTHEIQLIGNLIADLPKNAINAMRTVNTKHTQHENAL